MSSANYSPRKWHIASSFSRNYSNQTGRLVTFITDWAHWINFSSAIQTIRISLFYSQRLNTILRCLKVLTFYAEEVETIFYMIIWILRVYFRRVCSWVSYGCVTFSRWPKSALRNRSVHHYTWYEIIIQRFKVSITPEKL